MNKTSYQSIKTLPPNNIVLSAVKSLFEFYPIFKDYTEGYAVIGTPEGDEALKFNEYMVLAGRGNSAIFCDHFLDIKFDDTTQSDHPWFKDTKHTKLPHYLKHPPPMPLHKYEFNAALSSFNPIETEYATLPNYAVTFSDSIPPEWKLNSIATNSTRLKHGLALMFIRQVKPRALSPVQQLLTSMMAYRCYGCTLNYDKNCRCYTKSSSLHILQQMLERGKGTPFYYKATAGGVTKSRDYPIISSLLPTLWYAFCELSFRTGAKALTQSMETATVDIWCKFADGPFYGNMLLRRKLINKLQPYVLAKTDIMASTINGAGSLLGYYHWGYGKTDIVYSDVILAAGLQNYFVEHPPNLNDEVGRHLYAAINSLGSVPAIVQAPIALGLLKSSRATYGERSPNMFPKKQYRINDTWITVEYTFGDEYISAIYDELIATIFEAKPNLSRLETDLIHESTTNSAGRDPEYLALFREDLRKRYPAKEADDLSRIANVRMFDVVNSITNDLKTIDAYLGSLARDKVGTYRNATWRRARIIIMVATTAMIAGFILLHILYAGILGSPYCSSGKTTNDMRDMVDILQMTGEGGVTRSNDVVGMDTSTWKSQRALVACAGLAYARSIRELNYNFFLNKKGGFTLPVLVQTRTFDGESITESWEHISVIEFVIASDIQPSSGYSRVVDGYFFKYALANLWTFDSGNYKTSAQHTSLGDAMFKAAEKALAIKFPMAYTRIQASVMGDDQVSKAYSFTIADQEAVDEFFTSWTNKALSALGYNIEPSIEVGVAEYLKLRVVFGQPSQYQDRITITVTETGEEVDLGSVQKLKNVMMTIREFSARVPRPQHTVPIMYAYAATLSYALVKTFGGKLIAPMRYPKEKTPIYSGTSNSEVLTWGEAPYKYQMYIFPKLWYCSPAIGVPPPACINNTTGEYFPMSSWLAAPSPATCRHINKFLSIGDENISAMQQEEAKRIATIGLPAWLETLPPSISRLLKLKIKRTSMENVQTQLVYHPVEIPVPIEKKLDLVKAYNYGIPQGYLIFDAFRTMPQPFEPGPAFMAMAKNGNRFLDRGASIRSVECQAKLRDMGIRVSDKVLYAKRFEARVTSAAEEKMVVLTMPLRTVALFDSLKASASLPHRMVSDMLFGDYSLFESPLATKSFTSADVYNNGFGTSVPPKSVVALLMQIMGTPLRNEVSHEAVTESITKELNMKNLDKTVLELAGEALRKGGKPALDLFYGTVNASKNTQKGINRMLETYGGRIFEIRYELIPRLNFTIRTISVPPKYQGYSSTLMPVYLQNAYYVSEVLKNPSLLTAVNTVVPSLSLLLAVR